jgi:hypothetical protein
MRLNFTNGGAVRLELIFLEDELVFPDRVERVVQRDMTKRIIYTERIIKNDDGDSKIFPFKVLRVAYGGGLCHLDVLSKDSFPQVYDYEKMAVGEQGKMTPETSRRAR